MRAMVAFLFFIIVSPSWAEQAIITDGDTLIVNGITYRLNGIDAPESDQLCLDEKGAAWTCGIVARDQLTTWIGRRAVSCEDNGPDTAYRKRRIGTCKIEGEAMTINQWLVREGWALNFEPYAKGRFKLDESSARENLRGIWKGCFSAPQEQRRWKKTRARLLGAGCANEIEARNLLFPDHPAMPANCSIKGKLALRAQVTGYRGIYHMEGCRSYGRTKNPDRWFCSEDDARAEGFRKAYTC